MKLRSKLLVIGWLLPAGSTEAPFPAQVGPLRSARPARGPVLRRIEPELVRLPDRM